MTIDPVGDDNRSCWWWHRLAETCIRDVPANHCTATEYLHNSVSQHEKRLAVLVLWVSSNNGTLLGSSLYLMIWWIYFLWLNKPSDGCKGHQRAGAPFWNHRYRHICTPAYDMIGRKVDKQISSAYFPNSKHTSAIRLGSTEPDVTMQEKCWTR